jgi:hypothetical protein
VVAVADYDAIGVVSETLVDTLREHMVNRESVISLDRTEITLTSPDDVSSDSDTRLSLYLYQVEQSDQQIRGTVEDDTRRGSPLALNLHYLLTAYPSNAGGDATANSRDQHSVLGLAMQVLHDNATLDGDALGPSFGESVELDVTMDAESEEKVSRVWNTFRDVPLYPSVSYEVTTVLIESTREEEIQRVTEHETRLNKEERPPGFEEGDGTNATEGQWYERFPKR